MYGSSANLVVYVGLSMFTILVLYSWYDLARTSKPTLLRKPLWALIILLLVPIGPFAYLFVEKLGITQDPSEHPEELTTERGGNLYLRGRH